MRAEAADGDDSGDEGRRVGGVRVGPGDGGEGDGCASAPGETSYFLPPTEAPSKGPDLLDAAAEDEEEEEAAGGRGMRRRTREMSASGARTTSRALR
jgi:hypothetical protein